MSMTTFLLLSVAMAGLVGLLASLLLRAWLRNPRHSGSGATPSGRAQEWRDPRDGKEAS